MSHNINQFCDALEHLAAAYPLAMEAAVQGATGEFDDWAARRINVIYQQPLPPSMLKRGRSGNLRDGRTMRFEGSGDSTVGIIEITGPAESYAEPRHELPTIPNPYFAEAIVLGSNDAANAAERNFSRRLGL